MEKEIICIRCFKTIKPKENFIEVIEWYNRKVIKKNHTHKSCWELFVDDKNVKREAVGLLRSAMNRLKDVGGVAV